MKRAITSRLSFKINAVIVVGLVLLMVVPSIIVTNIYTDRLMSKVRDDAVQRVELFADLCQDPLARQAYGMLVYNAKSLLHNRDVLNVSVFDADGINVVPVQEEEKRAGSHILVVRRDVVASHINAGLVGNVEVVMDLGPARKEISRLFGLMVFGILFASVVIILALTLLLNHFVGKPVHRLVRSVKTIATGDLDHRIENAGDDELGDLAESINIMTANLSANMQARREAEAELAELNQRLEKKVRERTMRLTEKAFELEQLNTRLTDLDRLKSSLLSQVSHELRTPLTSILGFAKLMNRDMGRICTSLEDTEESVCNKALRVQENLGIIEKEGERLTRLINDVLDLNKIEAGYMEWRDRELHLPEAVENAVKAVAGAFSENSDLSLEYDIPSDLPPVMADPDRFGQVLMNLLNNAAKFTPAGLVRVTARAVPDGMVEVSVSDTGIGIREDEQSKIFGRFSQVDHGPESMSIPKGTGLGLAICKEIVEHYEGSIRVESEYGKGSTFTFVMPVSSGIPSAE